jgi:hypothetical protein
MTLAQVKAAFPDQGVEEQMAAASARIAEERDRAAAANRAAG